MILKTCEECAEPVEMSEEMSVRHPSEGTVRIVYVHDCGAPGHTTFTNASFARTLRRWRKENEDEQVADAFADDLERIETFEDLMEMWEDIDVIMGEGDECGHDHYEEED